MPRTRDTKLDTLAATALCHGWSRGQICRLGRLADVVAVSAGTTLQTEDGRRSWSYHVLEGTVLATGEAMTSLTTAGGWLHGGGREPVRSAVTLSEVRALVFRQEDLRTAVTVLPIECPDSRQDWSAAGVSQVTGDRRAASCPPSFATGGGRRPRP